jgi:hypothetical protein
MNPEENTGAAGESTAASAMGNAPIIGYCRATGKPLTANDAAYVNGVMYSREYADRELSRGSAAGPSFSATAATAAATATGPQTVNQDISPGWAFVLGLIPGVGAIYNQQYAKGIFHMVMFGVLISIADRAGSATPLFVMMSVGWYFYMPFEAYHTARRRQLGQPVEEMSGLFSMPDNLRHLPIGPILLIGLGVIFLLDNLGMLRIDDIIRFWPVLLILAGVLMLMKRVQDRSAVNVD